MTVKLLWHVFMNALAPDTLTMRTSVPDLAYILFEKRITSCSIVTGYDLEAFRKNDTISKNV